MERKTIIKLLAIASICLCVGYVIALIYDYSIYMFGSAPFYVYILVRAIEFILPTIILLIIRKILINKAK